MPHSDLLRILCGMEGLRDPQNRPNAPDELALVASGITALVAKRILETKGDAMSAQTAQAHPIPSANSEEPNPLASHTSPTRHTAPDVLIIGAGPAGLAAAAELGRRGISALVLEGSDSVAGVLAPTL